MDSLFSAPQTMRIPVPRDYQRELIDGTQAHFAQGKRKVLMVAPTGAGKGAIASYIVAKSVLRGKRVAFLVNRRTLVFDMSKRVKQMGIEHGIIMGKASSRGRHLPVQVASVDTLRNLDEFPKADLVFIDEAHFAVSDSWLDVIARYIEMGAYIIYMTATPVRLDGRGLGAIAEVMVEGPTTKSLTERGYLVGTRNFAPTIPDLTGVHSLAGDFKHDELAKVMDTPKLVGDIVDHWERIAKGRPTIAFCVNKASGKNLAAEFVARGYRAEFADCDTKDKVRDQLWLDLAEGRIDVVTSVGIVSYGWDVPPVSCCILARPTKSLALHLQQIGRILRPVYAPGFDLETQAGRLAAISAGGKANGIVLDHAGNILRHGFADDEREWSLDAKKKRKGKDAPLPDENLPRVCPECREVNKPKALTCVCGYVFVVGRAASGPEHQDGDLVEITDKRTYRLEDYLAQYGAPVPEDDKAVADIIKQCHVKGYKPAAVHFKVRALENARNEYRQATGRDPQPYWSSAAINNMLELPKRA